MRRCWLASGRGLAEYDKACFMLRAKAYKAYRDGQSCNSSKGKRDLFRWHFDVRGVWPSLAVHVHYLKNIILFCQDRGLMDAPLASLDDLSLQFDWRCIPLNIPQPECLDGCDPVLAGSLLDNPKSETK